MYSKVNYGLMGFFVLLFTAGVIFFSLWLGKYGGKQEFKVYKLEMKDSISGLSKDSVVKLRGVNIGRVSKIEISDENIQVTNVFLKIKSNVKIKEDMKAYTQIMGITGLLFIEIDGGTNEAKTIEATDDYIPTIKTGFSWVDKTRKDFGNISAKAVALITNLNDVFSKDNISSLTQLLNEFKIISKKVSKIEDRVLISFDKLDTSIVQFGTSVEGMEKDFSRASKSFIVVEKSFKNIEKVSIPAISNLDKSISKFNKTLDRGDYNFKDILAPVLIDIEIMSNQINDLAVDIQRSPSDLFFKSKKIRRGPGE